MSEQLLASFLFPDAFCLLRQKGFCEASQTKGICKDVGCLLPKGISDGGKARQASNSEQGLSSNKVAKTGQVWQRTYPLRREGTPSEQQRASASRRLAIFITAGRHTDIGI